MNYNEIMELVKSSGIEVYEFSEFDFDFTNENFVDPPEEPLNKVLKPLGIVKNIDHYGGEGGGDTYYDVLHFVDHDVYIKISGWYSSYNGVDYGSFDSSCVEVKPVTKTVVVYE